MKRCPFVEWDPLGDQTQPRMTAHDIIIVHTMVGYLSSTRSMFKSGGYSGTESHYGIGGDWGGDQLRGWDGKAFQWQDRLYTADANLAGNPYGISIETADNAAALPSKLPKWTVKQVDTLVKIIAWECSLEAHSECPADWECHNGVTWNGIKVAIPPIMVPDSVRGRRGIGYHRLGCDPWRVANGDSWSNAYGKECPGQTRISQLRTQIIPMVQQVLKGEVMATPEETWEWDGIGAPKRETDPSNKTWQPKSFLRLTLDTVDSIKVDVNDAIAQVEANRDQLEAIAAKVDAIDPTVIQAAIVSAGEDAAAKVIQAGEALLAKLDAISVEINRGQ